MNGYNSPRSFRFLIGFDEVRKEFNMDAARFYAKRLAGTRQEKVRVLCFNNVLNKWDDLGTEYPEGYRVDTFGFVTTISKDGNGCDQFGKFGHYYSLDGVKRMAKPGCPQIIVATLDKVEFDNGVVFVCDDSKGGYKLFRGSRMSYSKGYDVNYDEKGGEA